MYGHHHHLPHRQNPWSHPPGTPRVPCLPAPATLSSPGVIYQERPVFPAFQPRPLCPAVCFCESDCFGCFVEQNPTGSASCSLGSCTCERASKFLSTCPCRGLGLIPRGEIAGSCGHSMLNSLRALFCLLWHLHSQQQCPKGSGFGCHCSSLLLLSFLPIPDGGEVLQLCPGSKEQQCTCGWYLELAAVTPAAGKGLVT